MSLKQAGNLAFKNQKYKQAVDLYEQYVLEQHPDNKNAFFNLGLCYSKLNQHQKSIEACQTAVTLDPTYEKAYYRLMKEYQHTRNHYDVFINARQYAKHEKDQSSTQVAEAREKMKIYKERFISESKKTQPAKKLEDKNQIFELLEPLKPTQSEEFNEQIDKYTGEWLEEWSQEVQSEDAKWEEIAYVARELDTGTGLSLAYLYLNQLPAPAKRKQLITKIKALKAELNIEQITDGTRGETAQPMEIEQDDTQASPQEEIPQNAKNAQTPKQENKPQHQNEPKTSQKQQKEANQLSQKSSQSAGKANKMQQLLQKKSQNKKIFEEHELDTKPEQKNHIKQATLSPQIPQVKAQKQSNQQIKSQKKQTPALASPTKSNPPPVSSKQQLSESQLQQLYKFYCSTLQKPKDIFLEVYKSIFSILNSKQSSVTMGQLLILIKKRVKKFKMIVASFSDNEQTVIFDLLRRQGMEEYAVDFAPKHYKPQ